MISFTLQNYKKIMEYANYIARCIEIARRGEYFVAPNPMVGAVLVRNSDEKVLAEGWHERYGEGHAEVNCFKHLEETPALSHEKINMKDCTLFVSLEPCSHYGKTPPCAKLIIDKGVGRVVVGMLDPNPLVAGKGIEMLRKAGIEVVVGVLEDQCRELNKRFLCLHEKHRPYVILKWAQTADGFVDKKREMPHSSAHPLMPTSTERCLSPHLQRKHLFIGCVRRIWRLWLVRVPFYSIILDY